MGGSCVICNNAKFPAKSKVCDACFEKLYESGVSLKPYLYEVFPEEYKFLLRLFPELAELFESIRINNEFLHYLSGNFSGASIVKPDKAVICYRHFFETILHEILHIVFAELELDLDLEESIVSITTKEIMRRIADEVYFAKAIIT